MNTATEELGHIEMLATAVALNLEGAPLSEKEAVAADPVGSMVLGGINMKNLLSAGLSAMPVDSDGVPFDMSHIYASGNIAADMTANVAAESTGRVLAVRLYNMTNDPGMKDMLSFLIARTPCTRTSGWPHWRSSVAMRASSPFPTASRRKGKAGILLRFPGLSSPMAPTRLRSLVGRAVRGWQGQIHRNADAAAGSEAGPRPSKAESGAQTEQM